MACRSGSVMVASPASRMSRSCGQSLRTEMTRIPAHFRQQRSDAEADLGGLLAPVFQREIRHDDVDPFRQQRDDQFLRARDRHQFHIAAPAEHFLHDARGGEVANPLTSQCGEGRGRMVFVATGIDVVIGGEYRSGKVEMPPV